MLLPPSSLLRGNITNMIADGGALWNLLYHDICVMGLGLIIFCLVSNRQCHANRPSSLLIQRLNLILHLINDVRFHSQNAAPS